MKKIILFMLLANSAFVDSCFIVKEKDHVLKNEGDGKIRYAPCSTFKIALAVMGYDAGILKDEIHPTWPFKPDYEAFLDAWKDDQNPTSWIKNSCVWYSQILTRKLGMKKFQAYVKAFDYGNQNLSGDKNKDNRLTHAWLSSSLEISAEEQMVFLEKLISNTLPVSIYAQTMTKNCMYLKDLLNGWKLYGKTGNGMLKDKNGHKTDLQHGWFIGYAKKGHRHILFVSHITDNKKQNTFASLRVKNNTITKLTYFLKGLNE